MSNLRGRVKWFNRVKGFGFIEGAEFGTDIFVHYSQIDGAGYVSLFKGEYVNFDVVDLGKGPQAKNVRVCNHSAENTPLHNEPNEQMNWTAIFRGSNFGKVAQESPYAEAFST